MFSMTLSIKLEGRGIFLYDLFLKWPLHEAAAIVLYCIDSESLFLSCQLHFRKQLQDTLCFSYIFPSNDADPP